MAASASGWLIGLVCIAALVIALVAAAGYTSSADYRNSTDSFGQTHTAQENLSAATVQTATGAGAGVSSGLLILAAGIFFIVMIGAAYALTTGRMKWK
jgi:hypothetical protein